MNHFFIGLIAHYGLPGMGLCLVIENMGIPFPTEVAYIVAQNEIEKGKLSYLLALLFLTLAHVVGALLSYWIGRRIAKGLHAKKDTDAAQQKMAHWFEKHGIWAVFFARFVGQVRPWSSYIAGTAEVGFWPFFAATTVGTILFNIISLSLTKTLLHYSRRYPFVQYLITFFILIGIFGFIIWLINNQANKRKNRNGSQNG